MAKILKNKKPVSGLAQQKLPRFFPDWKPGDAYGYEDKDFPSHRKEVGREEIEQEIRTRIAQEELKWAAKVDQARAKGIQEGIEQGRAEGKQEIEPAVDLLQQWIKILEAEKTEFFRHLEESLLKLGVFITEKIISREIRQDSNIIKKMVSNALTRVSHSGKIIIRVHPQDLETVKSMSFGELLPQGTAGEISLEGDHKVDQGGCIIETPGGIIDSRIKTQLDELFQEIFGEDTKLLQQNSQNDMPEAIENLNEEQRIVNTN
jgi:flagellar assembly protein FliH